MGFQPLIASIVLQAAAVLFFGSGFLLIRTELSQRSSGLLLDTGPAGRPSEGGSYDKVVILLIDALRHDFVFSPAKEQLERCSGSAGSLPWPSMPRTGKLLAEAVSTPKHTPGRNF